MHFFLLPAGSPECQNWCSNKKAFLVALLVFFCSSVRAQSDSTKSRSSLGFGFGLAHYRMVDQGFTFSKLPFWGTVPQLQLNYSRNNTKSSLRIGLEGSEGGIHTYEGALPSRLIHVQIAISYQRKLNEYGFLGVPSRFFVGAQLATSAWLNDNRSQLDNVDFLFVHGLHLQLSQHMQLSAAHRLRVSATLPTVAWVKREVYNGGINKRIEDEYKEPLKFVFANSRFTYLSPQSLFQLQLESLYRLGPRIDFSLSYRFRYVSNFSAEPIRMYSNELLAGFQFFL